MIVLDEVIHVLSQRKVELQAELAELDDEMEALPPNANEQEEIIAELRTLIPENFDELGALLKFVSDDIKVCKSLRCDGVDIDILSNICEAFRPVLRDEKRAATRDGMLKMRDYLRSKTGAGVEVAGDKYVLQQIEHGNL
jgi:hypothetical protein